MTVRDLFDILAEEVKRNADAVICDTAGTPILAVVNKGGILTFEPKDQLDVDAIISDIAKEYGKAENTCCGDEEIIMDLQAAGVNLGDLERYDAANGTTYAEWCRNNAPDYGLENCWLKDNYEA